MLKKIINNATLMSWSSYLIQFGGSLFIFPLLVKVYTPLEQSLWWLLNTVIGFAMLADSGFGAVLMRGVAYFNTGADYLPRNKEEFEKKRDIISFEPNVDKLADLLTTSNRVYTYLSLFMLFLLVTVGPLIMWNIMRLSHHRTDFWLAYLLLIPNCIVQITSVRWRSFMRGLGFIAKEARISANLGTVRIVAFIVILSFRLPAVYLILYMLLDSLLKNIFLRRIVHKWFIDQNKRIIHKWYFDKVIFKSLWTATWKEGLIQWGNYLLSSGNSIIMAQVHNAQLMADFLLTTKVISIITSVSEITLFSNIPKIYNLAAKNDKKNMRITSAGYIFLGLSLMVVACLALILFGNSILSVLNKQSRLVPTAILIIMVITQVLESHATFHAGIYISTNHVPFVIPTLVSGFIIVLGGFLIMPVYGLIGIILLRFLVQMSFNNWYAVGLSLNLLEWPVMKYLTEFPVIGMRFVYRSLRSFIFGK